MSYRIRSASLADIDWIVGFNQALARETEERALDRPTLETGVSAFLGDPTLGQYYLALPAGAREAGGPDRSERLRGADGRGITAAADERAIAPAGQVMITYEFSDWRNGPIWWIQSVYVEPGHRRRGVFRALHGHVRDEARRRGAVGLRLYVDRANRRAKETYRALGMAPSRYDMYEEMWA